MADARLSYDLKCAHERKISRAPRFDFDFFGFIMTKVFKGAEVDQSSDPKNSQSNTSGTGAQQNPHDETGQAAELTAEQLSELLKFKHDYLYLAAEFENYKKNAIKERSDLRRFGAERLAVDILEVVDVFEKALATEVTADNFDSFRKGIELTATQLKAALAKNSIEEIPALGRAFDPAIFQALSSEVSADLPPGHISRVFRKPYKLHDRVIRHGQVVVAKEKE